MCVCHCACADITLSTCLCARGVHVWEQHVCMQMDSECISLSICLLCVNSKGACLCALCMHVYLYYSICLLCHSICLLFVCMPSVCVWVLHMLHMHKWAHVLCVHIGTVCTHLQVHLFSGVV